MEARRELIEAVGERRRRAGRVERKQILDEFAKLAAYHRKHDVRLLSSGILFERRKPPLTRSLWSIIAPPPIFLDNCLHPDCAV